MRRKVCMVGGAGVGKTSLVERLVGAFEQRSGVSRGGTRVARVELECGSRALTLMVWDRDGDDGFEPPAQEFVEGSEGCLVVVDGTSRASLDRAIELVERVRDLAGDIPVVVAINKLDQRAEWQIDARVVAQLDAGGWQVIPTSARSGENVERAFERLVEVMLAEHPFDGV